MVTPYNNGIDFVVDNIAELQDMVARLCARYGRRDLAEEMFSDAVVGKADRAFSKFDDTINNDLRGYMFAQLHFYCRRWYQTYRKQTQREKQISENEAKASKEVADNFDPISALTRCDEVISLMELLSEYEKRLVRLHFGFDNTFEEIADKIGGSPSTLRVHCNAAVAKLRRVFSDE